MSVEQTLLIYSLSYLVSVFSFPLLAGYLIVEVSIDAMLVAVLVLSLLCMSVAYFRYAMTSRYASGLLPRLPKV